MGRFVWAYRRLRRDKTSRLQNEWRFIFACTLVLTRERRCDVGCDLDLTSAVICIGKRPQGARIQRCQGYRVSRREPVMRRGTMCGWRIFSAIRGTCWVCCVYQTVRATSRRGCHPVFRRSNILRLGGEAAQGDTGLVGILVGCTRPGVVRFGQRASAEGRHSCGFGARTFACVSPFARAAARCTASPRRGPKQGRAAMLAAARGRSGAICGTRDRVAAIAGFGWCRCDGAVYGAVLYSPVLRA